MYVYLKNKKVKNKQKKTPAGLPEQKPNKVFNT